MAESNSRWLVKDTEGRIRGPYTTQDVLKLINRGDITGEEFISIYPGGKWISISQDPTFYDKLLDVLTGVVDMADIEDTPAAQKKPDIEESIKIEGQPENNSSDIEIEQQTINDKSSTGDTTDESVRTAHKERRKRRRKKRKKKRKPDVIELVDLGGALKKAKLKKGTVPIVLGVLLLLFIYLIFGRDPTADVQRIHLVAPEIGKTKLDKKQAQKRTSQGVKAYLKDSFNGYIRAQNDLVQIVESNPKNVEVVAWLCMTYLELWPYTYQDSKDLRVVAKASQIASSNDPTGANGSVCRIVDLMVRNRFEEANNIAESVLESISAQSSPPTAIYYLKARLLEEQGDPQTALGYVTSAQSLWNEWLRVFVYEAQLYLKLDKFDLAAKRLQQVLQASPNHKIAKIHLGNIEYKNFRHYDKAKKYLLDAFDDPQPAPSGIAAQGYLGLSEIYLYEGDHNKALDNAQSCYSLSPTNSACKNLIVQLGGRETLSDTEVSSQQLIFEGDQFVREGDCNAAQAHYKAAFEANPKNGFAAMKAAKCLWELSFSSQAISYLNKAIKADTGLLEAYVLLSEYYTQRFDFESAQRVLTKAKVKDPKSYEIYRGFAQLELSRHNPQGAEFYCKRALKLYEADPKTNIVLAKSYIMMDDFQEAFSSISKATEIDVNNREAQIVYAEALGGIQGIEAGLDHLRQLVGRYPLITEYRIALGKMLAGDERYADAAKVFEQIISIDEKNKNAYIELGKVYRFLGKLEESKELFERAAVIDPADATSLFELGILYLQTNKLDEGIKQFQRVLNNNPKYPLAHYFMGKGFLLQNQWGAALDQANAEMQLSRYMAEPYLLAAEAYAGQRKFSLCAEKYQEAVRIRKSAEIYVKMAKCYRLSGSLDVASSMLGQASSIESGFPPIYKELGALNEMRGKYEAAIENYDRYLVLTPNAPDKNEINLKLRKLQQKSSF